MKRKPRITISPECKHALKYLADVNFRTPSDMLEYIIATLYTEHNFFLRDETKKRTTMIEDYYASIGDK